MGERRERSAAGADEGAGGGCEPGGFGRDFGGRVESWRGEGGDAADAGAVVGSCSRKSEGEAEGGGGEAAQREPTRKSLRA